MFKSKKLEKAVVLGASGITLFLAGGNPAVQTTMMNTKNFIEMPITHADDDDTFDLEAPKTSKQFTVSSNSDEKVLTKKVSKKEMNYLSKVNNLHDYHVHFTQVYDSEEQQMTGVIIFIRK